MARINWKRFRSSSHVAQISGAERPASSADRSAGAATYRLHRGAPPLGPGSWRLAISSLARPYRHSPAALMAGWLPLGLWALHRYFESGKWRHLAASAVCVLLQALTATYFLYFALLPIGVVFVAEAIRRPVPPRRLARHLAPILVLIAVTSVDSAPRRRL